MDRDMGPQGFQVGTAQDHSLWVSARSQEKQVHAAKSAQGSLGQYMQLPFIAKEQSMMGQTLQQCEVYPNRHLTDGHVFSPFTFDVTWL